MRFRIEPRDVPPEAAARRLGKTLPSLMRRSLILWRAGFHRPIRQPAISIWPPLTDGAMLDTRTCSAARPRCRRAMPRTLSETGLQS